jgi:hypothetical protein
LKGYYKEAQRIQNSAKAMDAQLDTIVLKNTEVWVGKSDKRIYKVLTQVSAAPTPGTTTQASGTVNIALNLKNYNKPSNIVAPASYKNFVDLVKELSDMSASGN